MPEILALVPYQLGTAGGQRTTIECWAPILAEHGIHVRFAPFESAALHRDLYLPRRKAAVGLEMALAYRRRLMLTANPADYDAVFVYREASLVGPEFIERLAGRRGLPLIYCLDDPLFVPYHSPSNGVFSRLKFPGKVARICSLARAVIVNSSPLRSFAKGHNSNVWLVPSLVDGRLYRPLERPAGVPPRLGWTGSSTSDGNLDILAEPLSRLACRVAFELHLIGTSRDRVGDVAATTRPWSAAAEVDDLRCFDIGLLPLGDHPWNPWKFSLKLAQYMALGIPPVCSPTASNREMVDHGISGFLAETAEEWVRYLEELIVDDELRRKMGHAAAAFGHQQFTVDANRDTVVGAFRSVLECP